MKVSNPFEKLLIFGAIGNDAHNDIMHAIYRGVLYFLNVVHVKT